MGLALWLSGPVVAGTLAALWCWWVERPKRRPKTSGAIREHGRYLESLVVAARGSVRVAPADEDLRAPR